MEKNWQFVVLWKRSQMQVRQFLIVVATEDTFVEPLSKYLPSSYFADKILIFSPVWFYFSFVISFSFLVLHVMYSQCGLRMCLRTKKCLTNLTNYQIWLISFAYFLSRISTASLTKMWVQATKYILFWFLQSFIGFYNGEC